MRYCFLVDTPLGKLARWLRVLGFDAQYVPDLKKRGLKTLCGTDRVNIVRPGRTTEAGCTQTYCVVRTDRVFEQIREIGSQLDISKDDIKLFSRCTCCNSKILAEDRDRVRSLVPDYIWQTHKTFNRCPECDRIYWRGSHMQRSMDIIRKLF